MIDLKFLTIESYADSLKRAQDQSKLENSKIILLTPFGLVEGKYKYIDTQSLKFGEDDYDLSNVLMAARNIKISKAIENTDDDNDVVQKTHPIVLEDVKVFTSGLQTYFLPYLTLFSDQIIGVSMGELQHPYIQS